MPQLKNVIPITLMIVVAGEKSVKLNFYFTIYQWMVRFLSLSICYLRVRCLSLFQRFMQLINQFIALGMSCAAFIINMQFRAKLRKLIKALKCLSYNNFLELKLSS